MFAYQSAQNSVGDSFFRIWEIYFTGYLMGKTDKGIIDFVANDPNAPTDPFPFPPNAGSMPTFAAQPNAAAD